MYSRVDKNAHLCAGEGHAAASGGCNGDSGGPLACVNGAYGTCMALSASANCTVQPNTILCSPGLPVTHLGY